MVRLRFDAEHPRKLCQLVCVLIRVRLAGKREGVEEPGGLDRSGVQVRRVEEPGVEADVVPDEDTVAGPRQEPADGFGGTWLTRYLGVGDAVQLAPYDLLPGIHERRPAVADLAVGDLDRADLDDRTLLVVTTRRLEVEHHEGLVLLDGLQEGQDGLGPRLHEGLSLGLADLALELFLQIDQRCERPMTEHDRLGHHGLGQDLRPGLHHHDRVAGPGHDEVEFGLLELRDRRVEHELAADAADPDGGDRPEERDLTDRQRRGSGEGPEDVGIVLLVGGEDREDDLDVVLVAVREERADWAIGQAGGEDRRLGRARLTLDEATRDLSGGVHPLLEVDREREEVEPGARVRAVRCAEHERIAVTDGDGAAREQGKLAGLDGQRPTSEFGRDSDWHQSSKGRGGRTVARWEPICAAVNGPRRSRGPRRAERTAGGALAAQAEPADDGPIAGVVPAHQVRKEATTLPNELQETAARMVIPREGSEMFGEAPDPLRQQSDLDLG